MRTMEKKWKLLQYDGVCIGVAVANKGIRHVGRRDCLRWASA